MNGIPDSFWQLVRAEVSSLAPGPASRQQAALERTVRRFAERGSEGSYLDDPLALAVYVRAFLPYEIEKISYPLDRARLELAGTREVLRVADCGAGPGSASLGFLAWLSVRPVSVRVDIQIVDRSRAACALAGRLVRHLADMLGLSVTLTVAQGFVPAGPVDLVLVQNALGEAARDAAHGATMLRAMLERLAPGGRLVAIEPASRERSRFLLESRDALLASADCHVVAPCTRQEQCPALAQGEWCSMELPLQIPRAARLGLREAVLPRLSSKLSYLVLAAGSAGADEPLERVVSAPLKGRGYREAYLCGRRGRVLTRLLKRNSAPGNRAWRRLRRGDLVRLHPPAEETTGRRDLAASDRVDVIDEVVVAGWPRHDAR